MKNSVCFLGTGRINKKHIATVRKLFPRMRIGIASRDSDRALLIKEKFDLSAGFGNYSSAIHSDFTSIVIGVPPLFHHALIRECLSAGKHILIEKPILSSLNEFKGLWPGLTQSKGIVMVAENQWFDPLHRKIKKCLKETDFGKPLFMDIVRLGVVRPKGWRSDPAQMPMGALHEGGVHWIRRLLDLACVYEDEPYTSVLGVTAHRSAISLTNVPGEDTMAVIARHRSGLVSRLYHSWGVPRRTGFLDLSKIHLEKGAVYFDCNGLTALVFGGRKKILFPSFSDFGGFKNMWRHFIDCIENQRRPDLSLKDIYLDFAYADAAYRSSVSHKEETLEDIPVS